MNMFTCGGKKLKLTIWGVGQDMVNVSNDDCNQYNISLGVKHPSNLQNEFEELKIQYRDLRFLMLDMQLIHLAWEGSLSPPRFLHIHKVTLKERNLDLTDKVNHVESKLQFIALCYSIWIVKARWAYESVKTYVGSKFTPTTFFIWWCSTQREFPFSNASLTIH
ncbi:uncharacterized protein LOC113341960 isoform X2 [Papaver somniferum]|uniref:uncharacterized protein LOC113341960 isoform X2 n=1 Tax=Papaver somniferum TaxID=3469 RepID=UPI000E703AB8|nr:uncharacterized protein LOC113341960 isoform X2 [Papaver somniferum]